MNPLHRITIATAIGIGIAAFLGIAFRKPPAPDITPPTVAAAEPSPASPLPAAVLNEVSGDELITRTISANPTDPAATDLQRAAFATLQKRLTQPVAERLREEIARDPASYHARLTEDGGAALRNSAHAMAADVKPGGAVEIHPSGDTGWTWQMEALGLPVASPLAIDGARIERSRGPAITEWYVNEERGLEQFFTLAEPIARDAAGESRIRVAMKTALQPDLEDDDHLVFRDAEGNEALHYHGLAVFDAECTPLPSRMELETASADTAVVALVFDTAGARFPVTVDPFVSTVLHRFDENNSAYPSDFAVVNGTTFVFAADDGIHGKELWKSDGTAAGTVMVKDLEPGAGRSEPKHFTVAGSMLMFSADTSDAGRELWKTDLTEAGTELVLDIDPGYSDGIVTTSGIFNVVGSRVIFPADNGTDGRELWSSNGTAGGTGMLKDINTGGDGSNPAEFAHFNSELFFQADDGAVGKELWKTDGTPGGTVLVADINITTGSNPRYLTPFDGDLYFQALGSGGAELWKSDGIAGGTTEQVKDILFGSSGSYAGEFTVFDGALYFSANNGLHGSELWKSDGTELGTVLIKDIHPGIENGSPTRFVTANGTLFFRATDATHGTELWKSDGTKDGTELVKDIKPGSDGSNLNDLFADGSSLYFSADDDIKGDELWMSDGTTAGTVLVKDIDARVDDGYPEGGNPGEFFAFGGTLFFAANNSQGSELWTTDGTTGGTALFKDINRTGNLEGDPVKSGNHIFFAWETDDDGVQLWSSDGTVTGTAPLIPPGHDGGFYPEFLTDVDGTLFFQGSDEFGDDELWKSNGTSAGTVLVKDISLTSNSHPEDLTAVGSTLFFSARDATHGRELWKSDGTATGTVLVKDIRPGTSYSEPTELANLNGTLLFRADDGTNDEELWKSDGTEAGTVLVKDIFPGNDSSGIENAVVVSELGLYFFAADDGVNGNELWKSDGTEAGTMMVMDIEPGPGDSDPSQLTDGVNTLYFEAFTSAEGRELWISDGTEIGPIGTRLVLDIAPGPADSNLAQLTPFAVDLPDDMGGSGDGAGVQSAEDEVVALGVLAFLADDGTNGLELWIASPINLDATEMIHDLAPGAGSGLASDASIVFLDRLYFAGNDGSGAAGTELYSPPTTEEPGIPVLHEDLIPGPEGSHPAGLIDLNGQLIWFAADDQGGYTLRSDQFRTQPAPPANTVPDLTIGKKPGSQKGDNLYNASGAGQKQTLVSKKLKKLKFHGRIGNDGTTAGLMSLTAPKGDKNFKINYFGPAGNVTGQVISSGYGINISPATFTIYRIEIKPKGKLKNRKSGKVQRKSKTVLVKLGSGLTDQIDGIVAKAKAR